MKTGGVRWHQCQPANEEQPYDRQQYFVPGLLVLGADARHALLQQLWVTPKQPQADTDYKGEHLDEIDPPRKPGDASGTQENDQPERQGHPNDLGGKQPNVD